MINKFLKEIFEQPKVLENTLDFYLQGEGQIILEKISAIWERECPGEVIFTGMGSSYFAPHTANCVLSNYGIVFENNKCRRIIALPSSVIKTRSASCLYIPIGREL